MARDTSRPLPRRVLWGVALLGWIPLQASAQRVTDQIALSLLRPAQAGLPGVPQVLGPADAARLRRVFALQARGDAEAASHEAAQVEDRRLHGHVLADRWLRPGATPPAAEVQAWLAQYADHPDAQRVYGLLGTLLPRGAALPAPPHQADPLPPEASLAPEDNDPRPIARNPALERTLRDRLREGNLSAALGLIARTPGMRADYAGLLKGEAALQAFRLGRDEEAMRLGAEVARGAHDRGSGAFAAGLAAWQLGRYEVALPYFERAARNESAAPALRSAAAFWTARAAVRAQRPQLYVTWMLQAAQEPRTFYGLVARRALGLSPGFAWAAELGGEQEAAAVAEVAGGWRALALLQIGQPARAEAELRLLWDKARSNPALTRSMLAVASSAGMQVLAAQLAAASQSADGRPRDYARFPLPRLEPQGGFRVDPALLYGIALQESRFNGNAVSPAGARGLMQIMPATARFIGGETASAKLNDPAMSLELAQRYVHHLARLEVVEGNLIRLLAAYNAGPGNLAKWLPANGHRDDPFLFTESIPIDETRLYVQKVLANSWIYASRLGLPAPSLDQLAAGSFPKFTQGPELLALLKDRPRTLQ
jgi:soluble lytic murein transglycosylase